MLSWNGGARARLAAQQQLQNNQFPPPLGAKRVGFSDSGKESGDDDENGDEKGNEGKKAKVVDTLMGFPLPPPGGASFSGKYETAEGRASQGNEAANKRGKGEEEEEQLISSKAAPAGECGDKDEDGDEPMLLGGEEEETAVAGASSLEEAAAEEEEAGGGDTPATAAEMSSGGGGTASAAARAATAAAAPLAPMHPRRRHVFVLSRRNGTVRNLDLEAIDL